MEVPRRDSRGPDREWFRQEKQRIEDEIREEMQEAVSNVHILNQNMEHLNDVFLRQVTASNEKAR
ncbi:Hypothetical protein PHPALM_1233 [Phytophthora palmivora]|uniref:Uncharacterized protein n=1 Tax=Phytophthora palmivora TaxID=4796 RepID=A0A2P4YSW3_9STRA|nr:Hypothetical protein PHPALM_1233 [Phytophthora palmivora]